MNVLLRILYTVHNLTEVTTMLGLTQVHYLSYVVKMFYIALSLIHLQQTKCHNARRHTTLYIRLVKYNCVCFIDIVDLNVIVIVYVDLSRLKPLLIHTISDILVSKYKCFSYIH